MELIQQQFPIVINALNVGFLQTLKLFFVTLIGAIPLGLIISFGSGSSFKPLSLLCRFIVWVVRGTPLMIQLLIFYYFPGMVLENNIWGSGEAGRFMAAAIAFIINYACYFSEIYRGGIQGVPKGQQEAGLVLGMTKTQIFFQVTLLQMIKRIVPPMSNEIITLVKDTSLSRIIALQETHLGRPVLHEGQSGHLRRHLAAVFHGGLLPAVHRRGDAAAGTAGEETGLFPLRRWTLCLFLEVKNICKSFGSTEVLKGISFSLEQGQVVSIIGSSGSGKTTLLRCINMLEKATTGAGAGQ